MKREAVIVGGVLVLVGLGLAWWSWGESAPEAEPAARSVTARTERVTRSGAVAPEVGAPEPDTGAADGPDDAAALVDIPLDEEQAARAEALREELVKWQEMGVVHAVCPIEPPLPVAEGYLSVGDPTKFNGRRVLVLDGEAHLALLEGHPDGGHLSVEGYAAEPVSWTLAADGPGTCSPSPVRLRDNETTVVGKVTLDPTGDGAEGAWVEGCGNLGKVDGDGHYTLEALAGDCTLIAMRQDGRFRALSEAQEVTVEEGRDLVVDFTLPAAPRGGIGIGLEAGDEGMVRIQSVEPDGPADRAGLAAGEQIVAVDGVAVADMDAGEFMRAVGGAADSEFELTIVGDEEETRTVTLTREAMD